MKDKVIPRPLKKSSILLGIAILIFLFGLFPSIVLSIYSKSIYPIISVVIRWISSLFPFALGDILYAVLIIYILKLIIQFFLLTGKLSTLVIYDIFWA